MIQEGRTLLENVLGVHTGAEVDALLKRMEGQLEWIPVGDNPNNYGVISMGSEPFDGIAERITNAIDAMIELHVELRPELRGLSSPRKAVEAIHSFKGGHLWDAPDDRLGELASEIKVRFLESGEPRRPTVEIRDAGIGQHPSDFGQTLTSLNGGYKVTKFYLMGAFGQGGQTTFQRAKYCVLVSRRHPKLLGPVQPDLIGWTIVRFHDPSTKEAFYKQGRWEYCVLKGTRDVPAVPAASVRVPFESGTMVRLVAYDLPKGTGDVFHPNSTAWSYLSQAIFDPLLPLRLYEGRTEKFEARNQTVSGLCRRLWRGGKGEKAKISSSDSYILSLNERDNVTINYWTLSPANEQERWADVKKNYVSGTSAVFITLNGQRHSTESTTYLRETVGMPYSSNYLIVQVDCDALTKEAKKDLFSSTRDRLIDGDFKETLLREIAIHLQQDRNILAFEKQRKERMLANRTERDTSRIKKMVGQFIERNPALHELIKQQSRIKENGAKVIRDAPEPAEDEIRPEELTAPILREIPTFLKITNARDPLPVEKGGNALVRLETDARDGYFEDSWGVRFRGTHSKGMSMRRSVSLLRSGKISYYVSCPSGVRVGAKEILRFELDLPNGGSLSVERELLCVPPADRPREKSKKRLPEPNIVEVSEADDVGLWNQLSWTDRSVGQVMTGGGGDPGIYISLDNRHLRNVLKTRTIDESLRRSVEERYVAGIVYYLILRTADRQTGSSAASDVDDADDSPELDRLARTVAVMATPPE